MVRCGFLGIIGSGKTLLAMCGWSPQRKKKPHSQPQSAVDGPPRRALSLAPHAAYQSDGRPDSRAGVMDRLGTGASSHGWPWEYDGRKHSRISMLGSDDGRASPEPPQSQARRNVTGPRGLVPYRPRHEALRPAWSHGNVVPKRQPGLRPEWTRARRR